MGFRMAWAGQFMWIWDLRQLFLSFWCMIVWILVSGSGLPSNAKF